jgi:CubicO group peptidase (beta-lactamase class C family)
MRLPVAIFLSTLALPAVAVPADFDRQAAAILRQDVVADGPGVSAVVSENGRVVWSSASGRGDLSTATPLTPDSLFRYASISKQFTAALVLKLVDEGRLSLDDDLGKLLPTETPPAWHKVTVRQLLNHTSGIPSYTGKPGFMSEAQTSKPATTQQLIDITRADPLDFAWHWLPLQQQRLCGAGSDRREADRQAMVCRSAREGHRAARVALDPLRVRAGSLVGRGLHRRR